MTALAGLVAEAPVADFSNDNGWLVLGKALFIFVYLVVTTLLMIWAERRVVGRMQSRPGPNRLGPFGLLQSLADGVKLALKEDITPKAADKVVFVLAPVISATTCFIAFAVVPFGPEVSIFGIRTPLQLTDLPVAILYVLAVAAVGVYGLVLAGWSSGSTYPLLGGLRSTAQVISYEIAMGLSLISVFLYAGTMSTSAIVARQASGGSFDLGGFTVHTPSWYAIMIFPAFAIYCISMVGETNRAPFDLPEAEGELVGGFHTEYSSLKFALFFLAEYVNMVTVSAIATTCFLGGWRAPWPISAFNDGMFNQGWWPMLWFTLKLWTFLFVFIWLRGTLPRLRYDQFMHFGWKRLIPFSLVWILVASILRGLVSDVDATRTTRLVGMGLIVVAVILMFWVFGYFAEPEERQGREVPDEVDPFEGGFPVPPMPGQRLVRTNGRVPAAVGALAGSATATGWATEAGDPDDTTNDAGTASGEVRGG